MTDQRMIQGEIIENIKDVRIRFFYQENQGAHKTLNRGIRLSKGKYISLFKFRWIVYDQNRLEICFDTLGNGQFRTSRYSGHGGMF